MKIYAKLKGLSKPASFTCESLDNEEIFWAKSGLPQDRFDALFKYADGNWKDEKVVEIECDATSFDGTPINAVVINVTEASDMPKPSPTKQ